MEGHVEPNRQLRSENGGEAALRAFFGHIVHPPLEN
jgi:hypothetical protein